jgi:hypothetical protein
MSSETKNIIAKLNKLITENKFEKVLKDLFANDQETLKSIVVLVQSQQILKVLDRLLNNNELLERFDELCTSFQKVRNSP